MSFISSSICNGGLFKPIIAPIKTGSFLNPSVCIIDNKILINFRYFNNFFYHPEKSKYKTRWKNFCANNEIAKTSNYIGYFDENLESIEFYPVNLILSDSDLFYCSSKGLEDCRLVGWNSKMYLTGTKSDATSDCMGKIQLSEISFDGKLFVEISKLPISAISNIGVDKNWMPIIDQAYSFIKWSNPTEIINIDINTKKISSNIYNNYTSGYALFKGGSQVIKLYENNLSLIHETINNKYYHRFILWDKDWNVIKISKQFSFLNSDVEYACGMALFNDSILISLCIQETSCYILQNSIPFIMNFIYDN
jgi:hypothetical protein